jgi:phenylacetate-coenzyme A ligase PaaK-like adenylate-forming protein
MNITPLDSWIRRKIGSSQPGLTRQAVQEWQLARLNETLARVRSKSAFYRKHLGGLPDHLDCLEDLSLLPFTSASDLRQSPLQFVCVSQDEIQRVVTLQSSGTTGEPKRLYFTADDQALTVDFFGVGMSTLTQPGDRVLIFLPGETPGSVGDLLRLGLLQQSREPIPYGPVRDPLHALERMDQKKADCLVGSPTQVLGLARRWQPDMHSPRTVLLTTDYVPNAIVRVLEEIWGCEVYNHYGATEFGLGGGVECEAHAGYHVREADLYFEIVDPATGQPVQEGDYGEVVFTTLTRHGMPLIRYRLGDRSRFLPGACPCGTVLRRMETIRGRYSDLISIDGRLMGMPDLDEALFPIPDLLDFSATLTQKGRLPILKVETRMLTTGDVTSLIENAIRSIPAAQNIELIIESRFSPNETGSLLKRTIHVQQTA